MAADNLGGGKISRLVGRLRSHSNTIDHTSSDPTEKEARPPMVGSGGAPITASHDSFRSHFKPARIMKTPSFVTSALPSSHSSFSSSEKKRSSSSSSPDSQLSLQLWDDAYDHLRDAPPTAGLVAAFEGIVCQELPDHLKMGMSMTFGDHPERRRAELMETIAASGVAKRRASKGGSSSGSGVGVEDETRRLLDVCKGEVAAVMEMYPSAAVAYCGLCTLTPLLLDPLIQRHDTLRRGFLHLGGRIRWYLLLSNLLGGSAWESDASYRARAAYVRDTLGKLYRKVLEFQMTLVCATASAWNRGAKKVVDWQGLGQIVEALEELDGEVATVVEREASEAWRERLGLLNGDLDPGAAGGG